MLGEGWEVDPQCARRTNIEVLLHSAHEMGSNMARRHSVDVVGEEAVVELLAATDDDKVGAVRVNEPVRDYGTSAGLPSSDNDDIPRCEPGFLNPPMKLRRDKLQVVLVDS